MIRNQNQITNSRALPGWSRRRLLAAGPATLLASAPGVAGAQPLQPFTVLLDWFVNPDHAPLFAAKYIGAYEKAGLDVRLVAPTDPDLPPRLLAAGKTDVALSYQTEIYLLVDQGLPLIRSGTVIDHTLSTLTALRRSGITRLEDFKGRKIGYSVAGTETAIISAMLASVGLSTRDVTLVNVNFNLVSALMSHEVDGVVGTFRTYEDIQLAQAGLDPVVFYPEQHGVPPSDELIILSNTAGLKNPALPKFLQAIKAGAAYLAADPARGWQQFAAGNPSLNDRLNRASWDALQPYFAPDPFAFDRPKYTAYRDFMFKAGLIKHPKPVEDYAIDLAV